MDMSFRVKVEVRTKCRTRQGRQHKGKVDTALPFIHQTPDTIHQSSDTRQYCHYSDADGRPCLVQGKVNSFAIIAPYYTKRVL